MFFCPFGSVYPAGAGCLIFGTDLLIYQKKKKKKLLESNLKNLKLKRDID